METEEDSWVDIVPLGQEKNVMRLTVTVEQITSDTTGFKSEIKESSSKVVASAVHEWTPTDAGDGAESETTARRHGDAGSLYGERQRPTLAHCLLPYFLSYTSRFFCFAKRISS